MSEPELNRLGPGLPGLARRAIEDWALGRQPAPAPAPEQPSPAPVFVTLRDLRGDLRGCIGTLSPATADVRDETTRAAVLAASGDPRFDPVQAWELPGLTVEVSVLLPASAVTSLAELAPARYGVIVRDEAGRRGVLLPDVPGIDDAEEQVTIARRKAGIPVGAAIQMERFEVLKFIE